MPRGVRGRRKVGKGKSVSSNMSLTFTSEDGWIISHLKYIDKIYSNINSTGSSSSCSLKFNEVFFDINTKYLRHNQNPETDNLQDDGNLPVRDNNNFTHKNNATKTKKRKKGTLKEFPTADLEQMKYIRQSLSKILSSATEAGCFAAGDLSDQKKNDNNKAARLVSEKFYTESYRNKFENLHGSNKTENAIISETRDERYVFPEKCSFYCYDIRCIEDKINMNNQFDFILLDPPWWNKSIRRKKSKCSEASYKMMYNEELAKIPIGKLLSSNGIVAVWCTNAPSHLKSISEEMFPAWGVSYQAKWYWVKVTSSGETVCDFNPPPGKQPYELLLLGSKSSDKSINIPDGKLIVSIPSAVHSHKPPLTELIKSYLPSDPNCLEIFARYLLPGWTSWGLEVLKFQHLSLYSIIENETGAESTEIQNTR